MGIEIERKFLITNDGWREQATRHKVMRQGYLSGEGGKSSIRVRLQGALENTRAAPLAASAGFALPRLAAGEARLNMKAAIVGSARAEYDYEIPLKDGQEILDTLCVGLVDKTRHYIDAEDGLVWEIDEFAGDNAGLIVAEIELRHIDQRVPAPAWLGRDVTEERRYYNHALALHPYRTWSAADRG